MSLENARALDTSKSVVVEACAGSGKTWLLSSRIVRALLEGVAPKSILALTFTNKAAAEMRNRVIGHLRDMADMDQPALRVKLQDWGMQGDALERAVRNAPDAFSKFLADPQPPVISTFHSWYIRLVAMAPLKMAGWATLSLSQRPWDLLRQAWQVFYAEHADHVPYGQLVALLGSTKVREAMQDWVMARVEWQAFGATLDDLRVSPVQAADGLSQVAQLNAQATQAFYQTHQERAGRLAKAYARVEGREDFCGLLTRWDPADAGEFKRVFLTVNKGENAWKSGLPQRLQLKGGNDKFVRKTKDLGVWGADGSQIKADVQQLGEAFMQLLAECDERLAAARTRALWICSLRLAQCMEDIMGRSHETDFSGLELKAWELLGGELAADFHARLDTRIEHVLIDEFQDTNPVQWAMLRNWFSQYEQDDDALREGALKVFIVGDPKQSIYRFRRADPQVFRVAAQWLKNHYEADELKTETTYRCGRPVVDFLNAAMPGIASADRFSLHDTLAKDHEGFVARLPLASDWAQEGKTIAQALVQLLAKYPELKWSDIRILVRARTHMAFYEAALAEAGIPFVSDRAGGLLTEPEVLDVIALLRFLAFPWSDLACAHALKSPIFGISDAQLAKIAMHAQSEKSLSFFDRLNHFVKTPEADPELVSIAATLNRWIDWSLQLPVHDMLDRVLHDQDVFDRIAARFVGTRGLQCLANLEAFIALALDLDTGRLPSLPRFLQELNRWSQAKSSEAPGPGVMPNALAVSLSTLHGAKGLEAKVVVLAGLMDRDQSDKGLRWLIHWNGDRDAIIGATSWDSEDHFSPIATAALIDERRQIEQEDFNLLYVGITRAKKVLLLSATGEARKSQSASEQKWFEKIKDHCKEWDPVTQPLVATAHRGESADASGLHWRGIRFPKVDRAHLPRPLVEATAIRQGRALHRLLEFGPNLSEMAISSLIAEFALPRESRQKVVQAVGVIAQSKTARLIFDPTYLAYAESEWPIVSDAGIELIRPDRIVRISESPEIWWIIDFKWQVLDSERRDYAGQLVGYQQQFQLIRPNAQIEARILTASAEVWGLRGAELSRLDH